MKLVRGREEEAEEPVTEFLRFLMADWKRAGHKLKDLAAKAQVPESTVSEINTGKQRATLYSASRLALPLGYRDLPALVDAAYAWWRGGDRTQRPGGESAVLAELGQAAAELGYTAAEVRTAVHVAEAIGASGPLTRETAEELLSRARLFLRDSARAVEAQPPPPSPKRPRSA